MPPFAMGRIAWDNWVILQAIDRGIPVIDGSEIVKAIHLKHDYGHVKGGYEETRHGIDATNNLAMAGGLRAHDGKISAARYKLTATGMLGREQSDVDVIIPTIPGREEYLKRAEDSVRAQEYKAWNICGSYDMDGGQRSRARNRAINGGESKYICYLDDDDWYYPHHIRTLVDYLEATGSAAAYTLAHKVPESDEMKVNGPIKVEWHQRAPNNPLRGNWTPTLCVMHRRDCLDKVGMWDEQLDVLEDWSMWIRLHREFGMHLIPQITCAYSWRTSATIANPANDVKRQDAVKYILKEFG